MFKCSIHKFYTNIMFMQSIEIHLLKQLQFIYPFQISDVLRCPTCGKIYTTRTGLQMHQASHTGDYPFKCRLCGQGYTRRSLLQYHMNKHMGVKGFKCDICNKTFVQKCNLNRHMLYTHPKEDQQ